MKQGEQVALADATFTVTELTADARPAEVEVRFVEPLESPKLHWLQWGRQEYVPFTPSTARSPPGASTTYPSDTSVGPKLSCAGRAGRSWPEDQ